MGKKPDNSNKQRKPQDSEYGYENVMRNVFGQGKEQVEAFKIPAWLLYLLAYAIPIAALTRSKSEYAEMMLAVAGGIVLGSLIILSYNLANRANMYLDIENPLSSYIKYKQYNSKTTVTLSEAEQGVSQDQILDELFGPNVIERERPEEPEKQIKKKGFFRKKRK